MMELPATPPAPIGRQAPDPAAKRVLVVDDEPTVLTVTSRMLTTAGYAVTEASARERRSACWELGDPRVDLVITAW